MTDKMTEEYNTMIRNYHYLEICKSLLHKVKGGLMCVHSFGQAVTIMIHYHMLGAICGLQVPRHSPLLWEDNLLWGWTRK